MRLKLTRMQWRRGAFYDLRRTPEVIRHLEGITSRVLANADAAKVKHKSSDPNRTAQYYMGSRQGRKRPMGRWRTSIVTGNFAAFLEEGRHNTLQKALEREGTSSSTEGRG